MEQYARLVMEMERQKKLKMHKQQKDFKSSLFLQMPTLSEAAKRMYEDIWIHNKDDMLPYKRILYIVDLFGDPKLNEIDNESLLFYSN